MKAGLLRMQVRLRVSRELFLWVCVGDLKRQSHGQILLDRYRHQRRRSTGDGRLCHQPVTVIRLSTP